MNKQRKVLITTTYNEMGIVIDTKVEEVTQPNLQSTCNQLTTDTISRQVAVDAIMGEYPEAHYPDWYAHIIKQLPSAQPEQRYTEEELKVFQNGISLSLLSKRSSQHWFYDEDTATEIEFLEQLHEKVSADMRGETE